MRTKKSTIETQPKEVASKATKTKVSPDTLEMAKNICSVMNQLLLNKDVALKECYIDNGKFKIDYILKNKERTATQPLN